MTSKTKTTIEPGDVKTVELECKGCGFREVWPIATWRAVSQQKCACCGATWPIDRASSYHALMTCIENLNLLITVQKDATIPFRVHFEIPEQKITP